MPRVRQLAHGRRGLRRDLHQIKPLLLCGAQSFLAGHDAQLFAVFADQSDLLVGDLLVQLMLYLANTEAPPIQNKNADAPGIRETTQTALSGACMTLLTSLPLLEVRRMHRPSLFSRIFYTIPAPTMRRRFWRKLSATAI